MTTHLLAQAVNIPQNFFSQHPNAANLTANPNTLLSSLLPNIIVVAGLVFLFIIIYGGFSLLSDGGQGNAQVIAKHRQAITVGVAGFLIVISAYFILQIVTVITGVDFINPLI